MPRTAVFAVAAVLVVLILSAAATGQETPVGAPATPGPIGGARAWTPVDAVIERIAYEKKLLATPLGQAGLPEPQQSSDTWPPSMSATYWVDYAACGPGAALGRAYFTKWDLPADEVSKASTKDLILHCAASPAKILLWTTCDNVDGRRLAMERLRTHLRALGEAMARSDVITAIADIYRETSPVIDDPALTAKALRIESTGAASMLALEFIDAVLEHPAVMAKAAGREKELIALLAERDAHMAPYIARMGDAGIYNDALRVETLQTAARLFAQADTGTLQAWSDAHRLRSSAERRAAQMPAYISAFYKAAPPP
jgi:hypothetical protein